MPAYRYILIIIQLNLFQSILQPLKLTHDSFLIFNSLNSHFYFMFSYFFPYCHYHFLKALEIISSLQLSFLQMSTVWQKYPASWTSFLSVRSLHYCWDDFLLACVFPAPKAAQGSDQTKLLVQFTAWLRKELQSDGWWRQWGRGTRKEIDIPEPVLLLSKRNIESYCEILDILAFGCIL